MRDVQADKMMAELRRSGLKLTPQRAAIVRELASDASHPTAQEIFERLSTSMPSMSFATVYNTLDALVREGLCNARALSPGPTRFDPNVLPHDHAVCDQCGVVIDVMPRARPAQGKPPAGFAVRAVEQIFRGLCARCRTAKKTA